MSSSGFCFLLLVAPAFCLPAFDKILCALLLIIVDGSKDKDGDVDDSDVDDVEEDASSPPPPPFSTTFDATEDLCCPLNPLSVMPFLNGDFPRFLLYFIPCNTVEWYTNFCGIVKNEICHLQLSSLNDYNIGGGA